MRYLIIITTISFIVSSPDINALPLKKNIPTKIISHISKGHIYRSANVSSTEKTQTFNYSIAGVHPDSCNKSLKKLSRYEKFHEYMDLIKVSGYDDKNNQVFLYIDSSLLPFPMSLKFKLKRIEKPGTYHFIFEHGFLKGLKGSISVYDDNNKCLFYSTSHWSGKKTSIPNTIFEVFTETVGEMAMKSLFRSTRRL